MSIVSLGSIASGLQMTPYSAPPVAVLGPSPIIPSGVTESDLDSASASSLAADAKQQVNQNQQAALQNSQAILATGRADMSRAMQSFATDWQAAKTRIAALRPDLLDKHWDIETDQGAIVVVSNSLSTSDINWLTGILNQNAGLVADTQSINNVMVSTFSGTAAMAAADPLGMTLSSLNAGNIDGKVNFLSLLAGADYESYQGFSANTPNNLSLAVFGASNLNLPTVGQIGAISSLDPMTITKDHQQVQVQSVKGMQDTAYADTLNVAFQKFLSPQFAAGSAADGTTVAPATSSPQADLIATLIGAVNNPLGDMTSLSNSAVALTTGINDADDPTIEQNLQQSLGSAYRTYGEADTPVPATSGPADTATGAGSIQDVYDDKNAVLTPAQQSILGPMQALGADWETSKDAIAAVRPDLLQDDWDFVSDDQTIQAVSSSLTAEQKLWLTAKLNQNSNLVADTQAVNDSLAGFYQNQFADDTNALDSVANYGGPASLDLSQLTPENIDGRIDYLALMGGENPTQELVQSVEDGMPLV